MPQTLRFQASLISYGFCYFWIQFQHMFFEAPPISCLTEKTMISSVFNAVYTSRINTTFVNRESGKP
ncbi:predicted protein [Arabidopsis lyrata subsp. lyrata]|uniref:Predicted protein n=1 Tax=Arabidopsis lyrata subsp. lyrata TaxID=81972 RepID=D7LBI9_ARALL|nr:predicted protein [Arabidopsis lyrata subsp. lyrata]